MKKQQPIVITLSAACLLLLFIISACNKSSNDTATSVPVISTYPVINSVTTTTAQAYGLISYYGDNAFALTAEGICWSSTNQTPTIADSKTSHGLDTLSVAANLTALTPNTTYYVRAYATNNLGTGYGSVIKFKTNSATYAVTATVSTLAGNVNTGSVNGTGAGSSFYSPQGVCADATGNIYVADSYNNVIRKITAAGVTTTFAGNGNVGYLDGSSASAEFYAPSAVAIDASGNLYVADMGNNMIRKISSSGVVSTLAGRGNAGYSDGTGTAAVFKSPIALTVDASGNVFVADKGNNMIRQITPAGVVTTLAGTTTASLLDGTGTAAGFSSPSGVTVDSQGNVYVADSGNSAIRKIASGGVVTTLIGSKIFSTIIPSPTGICIDATGNLFISDSGDRIMEITTGNILISLAGSLTTTGFANGVNTAAAFNNPQGLTVDASGNIYVADIYNNMIRKIVVTTTP
ncbi:MAG: NHL repeat-containing protein [Mucilaginibacter sp.]|uniref:NHL repeat-containing protein n=1 Tax=Mucilaginibacter sp. TaxID=1882438 RepID=UPI0032638EF5